MSVQTERRFIKAKTLRGFRDYMPEEMLARERIISTIREVYESYGFVPLATPAFEYKEILVGYGEESLKQIYSFVDQEGKEVGLRFDLTVPLARVIAQYELPRPFKRYQIQPVWRFDKPDPGRFREFIQFDIDIVGTDKMIADAEIISAMHDSLKALRLTDFRIRFSSRRLLNSLIAYASIPEELSRSVFRVIDKLEKQGLDAVKQELGPGRVDSSGVEIQGIKLDEAQISKIEEFLLLPQSTRDEAIISVAELLKNIPNAEVGVEELKEISDYLSMFGISDEKVTIDFSIARGLDYYTGPVFEAILLGAREYGSVMAGGRYDQLIGLFSGERVPATGASIGIDRLFDAMRKYALIKSRPSTADVIVTIMVKEKTVEYLKMAKQLREEGINTEVYVGEETKIGKQLEYADKCGIPIAVIVGPHEFSNNQITLKDLRLLGREEAEIEDRKEWLKARIGQKTVPREKFIEEIKQLLTQKF